MMKMKRAPESRVMVMVIVSLHMRHQAIRSIMLNAPLMLNA